MQYLAFSGIIFQAYSHSDFFGKLIFLGLFALSLISWYVLIHKIWVLQNIKKNTQQSFNTIAQQKESILQISQNLLPIKIRGDIINPFAKIYHQTRQKTIEILEKNRFFFSQEVKEEKPKVFLSRSDVELIDAYIGTSITSQIKYLEKNLFVLATIVSLAPFLGILGTVWGILISLFEMQATSAGGSNSIILSGLSTALATTVLGLVIAIPALVCYNYLKNLTKSLYSDMNDFSHLLLSTVELQYRHVEI